MVCQKLENRNLFTIGQEFSNQSFDKIYFFYQHSQPLYDDLQKEIENLEFVRGVNFEFIDSLENNGTNYLLFFDDSCVRFAIQRPLLTLPPLGDIGV